MRCGEISSVGSQGMAPFYLDPLSLAESLWP